MFVKPWRRFVSQFSKAPDKESEQSLVRLAIALLMCVYTLSIYFFVSVDESKTLFIFALIYAVCSLLIIMAIGWRPKRYRLRRLFTMLFDVNMVTVVMWFGGESAAMLYVFYLWVSLGNGFRFGTPSLYFTSAFATLGFASVIVISDFWREQQILGVGLLVGLMVTTLYVALLLQRIEREKERADASNQAKSRFLANMSHEIRTPLNGVVGMTDLLARTPMGFEQREIMSAIQASAETLLNLIEEILDFSKIEAGKVEVSFSDQDVFALVDTVVSMLKPAADAKGIELNKLLDLDISPVIKTDPKLLRQILINLLNNAIKYTEQGSIAIKVTPYQHADPIDSAPRIYFEVVDSGIGISESQQKNIFERFEQGDDSANRRYSGSGLGTTITKQLVELLGGSIGVVSRLGEGSRFWFQIPAIPSEYTLDETHIQEARVLLFSDLLAEPQQLLDELQEWQVNVKVYNSIAEGFLELLNAVKVEEPYDIVIVDETHSLLSNDELLRVIRSERSLDDLKLVCVTHHSENQERETALCREGFSAVMTTPVTNEKVRHVLKYALKQSHSDCLPPKIFSSVEHSFSKQADIILAEDNLINQKVVKKILELQGHRVEVVSHGNQAIKKLNEQTFDLAILDLQMPDISGIDVIKSYRANHHGEFSLPFIILTANATREAAALCEEVDVNAYLTKPVRSAHLLDVVNEILGGGVSDVSTDTIMDQPVRHESEEKRGRVLDKTVLQGLEQLSKDPGFLKQLSDSFLRDCEALLGSMYQALEEGNIRQFKDSAHALADNASGIGAYSLMNICLTATQIEQSEFDEQGNNRITKISSTFSVTCQALQHYLNALKSSK
ncbi:MAG: ATP-binding protein [Candidatus Thiodiazotropha sp. DIVDIV]